MRGLLALIVLSCSCFATVCSDKPEEVADAYQHSKAVFVGTFAASGNRFPHGTGVFKVQKQFKGKFQVKMPVTGGTYGSFPFENGKSYLVYVDRIDPRGNGHVGICGRTKPIEAAKSELELLSQLSVDQDKQ